MAKPLFNRLLSSLFAPLVPLRGAAAGSVGLFLGLLPTFGFSPLLVLAASLLFRLNIVAMFCGLGAAVLLPFLQGFSFTVSQQLAIHGSPILLSITFKLSQLTGWSQEAIAGFAGSAVCGIGLSLLAYPAFLLLFHLPRPLVFKARAFVFQDETGTRRQLLARFAGAGIVIAVILLTVFGFSIDSDPSLPGLQLTLAHAGSAIMPIASKLSEASLIRQLKEEDRLHPDFQTDYHKHGGHGHKTDGQPHERPAAGRAVGEIYGFYVNWDENSRNSLMRYGAALTTVIPEWYHLKDDGSLQDETDEGILRWAKHMGKKVQPLVNNYADGKWETEQVHALLADTSAQDVWIEKLLDGISTRGESGINLDFEGLQADDQDLLTAFVQKLAVAFHARGLQVTEDVPANDDAYDYRALAESADRLIVMMYDEHDALGAPGPIASDNWYEQSLNRLDIPPDKLVVSLGSYGYDWQENGSAPADNLTYDDTMELARQSKLLVHWDDESGSPYMRYKVDGDNHIVWFLDAATFCDQLKVAVESGYKGVALWRLGSEDPAVWRLLDSPAPSVKDIAAVDELTPVHSVGDGEILRFGSVYRQGVRSFNTDADGYVSDERYDAYPSPFEVQRYGKPAGKQVALTFDDGPDPRNTPQILDILDRYGIKGTFFVVGENAQRSPDLIERIYREGHELGNHTFTHPNVARTSPLRTRLELNATQRLIQEITGHAMTFFRPPYVADAEPSTPEEIVPIIRGQNMGYTMVGEQIDPNDWARPGTDEIVRRVMAQLPEGNVILLHDAGGNREQTVQALPLIIEKLKAAGYTFTTPSGLIGKTRDETMPPVSASQLPLLSYDRTVFTALKNGEAAMRVFFAAAIALGVFRVCALAVLAALQRRKSRARSRAVVPHSAPVAAEEPRLVSVVVAAYNEEAVICGTIASLLDSVYPALEIIVVDDGSTDGTAEAVRTAYGQDPRVRLLSQPNGGKASAVNAGFRAADGDIVVALDADTLIAPDAIALLAARFADETVGAVSGNVRIGNANNPLTSWQHIEYVTGFNLERRAFELLNCITVVPGAIGAWRREAVMTAGGYQEDTLAEDTDLTLSLLRRGWRIGYEERAYAYTEAPEDVRSFLKQRYRWVYGTLQCLWKHRAALLNPKHMSLGFAGMPNMWIFQYAYQAISPLVDLLFVLSLATGEAGTAALSYGAFFLLDLAVAAYAFRLEQCSARPLRWLFLQRIVYRQLMAYTVAKSWLAALRGVAVGWNKLKRSGTASIGR